MANTKVEELEQLLSIQLPFGFIQCESIGTRGMQENYGSSDDPQEMTFTFIFSNDIFGIDTFRVTFCLMFVTNTTCNHLHVANALYIRSRLPEPIEYRYSELLRRSEVAWFDIDGDASYLNRIKKMIDTDPKRSRLLEPIELCIRLVHSNMNKLGFRLIGEH